MNGRVYGYARVSTKDQNESRQIEALIFAGVDPAFILVDKSSGKNFERPMYKVLKYALRQGDTLIIKSIDRLGRNYNEIKEEWQYITKHIKSFIKVLDMPLLDTSVEKENLTETFISDIVLQILSYVAETERENISKRQAEGIAAAKAAGKKFGRPKAASPENWEIVYNKWIHEEVTAVTAMQILNLKKNTFYNLVKRYKESNKRMN